MQNNRGIKGDSSPSFSVARELPLILLQCAWLVWSRLIQNPVLIDDAFIHFRNALNWAQGRGLIYNVGERVLATTSPVYTLLLGSLYRLTGIDFPRLANGFNFVCEVAIVLCLLHLLRRTGVPLLFRHTIVAITSFETWRMYYSHAGMEMSLFVLAITAFAICMQHALRMRNAECGMMNSDNPQSAIRHSAFRIPHSAFKDSAFWIAAGLLLGIMGWIRPESSVVWVAAALGLAAGRRWRELFRIFGVACILAGCISALLLVKYGTFIPQSVAAKAHAPWFGGSNGYPPVQFAITLGDLTPFGLFNGFRSAWGTTGDKINSIILLFGQIALMGFGVAWLRRRGERFLAFFLPLFVAGFYTFHATLATCIFDWYFIAYYYASLLLAGLGWLLIVEAARGGIARRWPGRAVLGRAFYPAAAIGLIVVYFFSSAWLGMVGKRLEAREERLSTALRYRFIPPYPNARELAYSEVAPYFNKLVPEGDPAQVGCMEIGIFGYYFHGRILDAFALVSPEALDILKPEVRQTLPPAARKFPYDVFLHFKPKFIMSSCIFLYEQPKIFYDYYDELTTATEKYGVLCYKLKDGIKPGPPDPQLSRK